MPYCEATFSQLRCVSDTYREIILISRPVKWHRQGLLIGVESGLSGSSTPWFRNEGSGTFTHAIHSGIPGLKIGVLRRLHQLRCDCSTQCRDLSLHSDLLSLMLACSGCFGLSLSVQISLVHPILSPFSFDKPFNQPPLSTNHAIHPTSLTSSPPFRRYRYHPSTAADVLHPGRTTDTESSQSHI